MILVRVSCIGSTRCQCDFSKEDFLDRTDLNDVIFDCVGLEMISIYLQLVDIWFFNKI